MYIHTTLGKCASLFFYYSNENAIIFWYFLQFCLHEQIGGFRTDAACCVRTESPLLHQRTAPVSNAATWLPAANGWVPGAITNKALAARNDNNRLEPWAPVVVATS